jgi:hypothetical protein
MSILIIYQPIADLSMITHSVILDTTNVLLYPVATPGLLDPKYNWFLIHEDTSASTKICLSNKITAVPRTLFPLISFFLISFSKTNNVVHEYPALLCLPVPHAAYRLLLECVLLSYFILLSVGISLSTKC